MTLHPDIERLALLGWHLHPAAAHSRRAAFRGASEASTCHLDTLETWASRFAGCNWRVLCGPSRIWGLDIDRPGATHGEAADGFSWMGAQVARHGPLPRCPRLRTGGGGLVLVFSHLASERICGRSGYPVPGIDPKRGRLTFTVPPSRHTATGGAYRWLPGLAPWEVAPPSAPAWLLKAVRQPERDGGWNSRGQSAAPVSSDQARARLYRALDKVLRAPEGSRNATLNRVAYGVGIAVRAGALAEGEAWDRLGAAALHTGLERHEVEATLRSAFSSAARVRS